MSDEPRDRGRVITTRTEKIWLRDDGILQCECLPTDRHDLNDAKENVRASAEILGAVKRPALIDARNVTTISREARRYYSGEENGKVLTAIGMLVGSPLSRVVGSFFLGLNKVPFPAKLFTSEKEALEWLSRFVPRDC